MINKVSELRQLSDELEALNQELEYSLKKKKEQISEAHADYVKSAANLAQYLTFRTKDHRQLQRKLGELGLSRLARAESHIQASVLNNLSILKGLTGKGLSKNKKPLISIKKSEKRIALNTKELLGYRSKGRRLRIMVTLPSEAAGDYELVNSLVKSGMNCARINCAHDGPEQWLAMIDHVRKASNEHKRNIRISMDLAGPKIRTGQLNPGPKVLKLSPKRNEFGLVIEPDIIRIVPESQGNVGITNFICISDAHFDVLNEGDIVHFKDVRGSNRKFKIFGKKSSHGIEGYVYDTCFIVPGIVFRKGDFEFEVQDVPHLEQAITLQKGDHLTLNEHPIPGMPAVFDQEGNKVSEAYIHCTNPIAVRNATIGEKVFFDDGKIGGRIIEKKEGKLVIEITSVKQNGSKLRADKGINFPDSKLDIRGLTDKDIEDLEFIAKHADIVNFSFVNRVEDVKDLHHELEKRGVLGKVGVILKIETVQAYNNLTDIIFEAIKAKPVGVMIARGDLAIETGWDNIGIVQKEILGMCSAAHIPIIWATQVLENLAKRGIPSRSEITDAVTALKAECVMLNKGVYINDAISLLSRILTDLEKFQVKNMAMLPKLGKLSNK